jgi:hypothetical protein
MKIPSDEQYSLAQDAPKSRAKKSGCSNLQKGTEVVFVILFRDVLHLMPRIQPAQYCHKLLDDQILLLPAYVIQSNVSPRPSRILWRFSMASKHTFPLKLW